VPPKGNNAETIAPTKFRAPTLYPVLPEYGIDVPAKSRLPGLIEKAVLRLIPTLIIGEVLWRRSAVTAEGIPVEPPPGVESCGSTANPPLNVSWLVAVAFHDDSEVYVELFHSRENPLVR
jgi:hypothetical protein